MGNKTGKCYLKKVIDFIGIAFMWRESLGEIVIQHLKLKKYSVYSG